MNYFYINPGQIKAEHILGLWTWWIIYIETILKSIKETIPFDVLVVDDGSAKNKIDITDLKSTITTSNGLSIINLSQNQENTQQQKAGGTTTIIKEKIVEKPVEKKAKKSETEDAPW